MAEFVIAVTAVVGMLFGCMFQMFAAFGDLLATVHPALPWVVGIVIALGFARFGYRLADRCKS